MEPSSSKMPFSCKLLIFLQLFLGVGAIFGGSVFVIEPSGDLINMPISLLEQTPFSNFLIPGIILLVVLGIIPTIISFALIKKWEWNKGVLSWELNQYFSFY
ncbi:hypothetical protein [Bacillus sp. 1NLA3E]|uniref:hypothetical protein n=1 Tax=Bacillus sp. 1NLA3E TaxID=666686 RepID=UPI000247EB6E|nr:hypothetical protein [Bacillus sp. 1NLA3E]AGK52367.1 hypothetical protein B1NLA3E_02935 [Bacillus sp. 1NLA3E]